MSDNAWMAVAVAFVCGLWFWAGRLVERKKQNKERSELLSGGHARWVATGQGRGYWIFGESRRDDKGRKA